MSNPGLLECFGCGRLMDKPHRIYKKEFYCGSCYAREFKPKPCPQCGEMARLPSRHPEAICHNCEKSKPCVRCGKEKYRLGLMSEYGPVCAACARYFSEMKPCSRCGALSHHLSRVSRLGFDEPVCPCCARADHGCCQACDRSRRLFDAPDGRRLCKKCLTFGMVTCSSCGQPMPAGLGKTCLHCYWTRVFEERLHFNASVLQSPITEHYQAFSRWMLQHCGAFRAARLLKRYFTFFEQLGKLSPIEPLSYDRLVKEFGADMLRRHRLVITWFVEVHGWVKDDGISQADSEQHRIQRQLQVISQPFVHSLLMGYYRQLDAKRKNGMLSLRSVRLALWPASQLLLRSLTAGHRIPEQQDLTDYLSKVPGQKAALRGFIAYLNHSQNISLSMRLTRKGRHKSLLKPRLEKRMVNMVLAPKPGRTFLHKWIITTLAYFHGLPQNKIYSQLIKSGVKEDRGGWVFHFQGHDYWIPKCSMDI